jgi:hypothetical protein
MSSRKDKKLREDIGKRIQFAQDESKFDDAAMTRLLGFRGPSEWSNLKKGNSLTIENLLIIAFKLQINFMWLVAGDQYDKDRFLSIPEIVPKK